MKNKINGIDVSECEFLECGMCNAQRNCDGYTGIECKYDNENCYYRQLKRLQEKNEGLKSLNDFNVQKIEVLQEENEELKARLKTLDDEVLTIEITPDEFERYKKYKQALEKIRKEYTNSIFYQCDKTEEECPCHNCIILGQLDRVQNIVKIIDEVLNDRD